jgi:acyl-CoA-dependent ceramide synthase
MTYIGVSIFVTMDFSDVFLAVSCVASMPSHPDGGCQLAKCVNYVNETASQPVFAFFIVVWT